VRDASRSTIDFGEPAMQSSQHGEHLTQVTRFGAVNVFLVREDDGLTLVDTGVLGSARGILAAAGVLGAPIVRIVLTHAHRDHAGSLDSLARTLPSAEICASAREARLLAGDQTMDPGEPPLRGDYQHTTTRPTRELAAGDRVGSLEVVAAPGHTPGHIALLDTRDRTLIAGDAYSTLGGVATSAKIHWRFPLPTLGTWHRPTALMSARTLLGLGPSRLAVGHGPTVEAPAQAMERAIAAAGG
jgi:glyoxylase-like metal-dependent hydrolase (beta-lactamase superfamily II)